MIKPFLVIFLFHFTFFVFAEKKNLSFEITPPTTHVQTSIYKHVQYIDARDSIADLGYLINKSDYSANIILPKYPLEQQITNLFDSLVDKPIKNNDLIIQVRRFAFTETVSGYCFLRIQLYCKSDSGYQKLALLDTVVEIKHGTVFSEKMEKRLFKACNITLTNFLINNLSRHSTSTQYLSLEQVKNIENFEKVELPLYKTDKYKDGLYRSFESFVTQQTSDINFTVKMKNDKIIKITKKYTEDYTDVVEPGAIYAVVYRGIPYITTIYGFYPLKKVKNDFYFTGKEQIDQRGANYVTVGGMAGRAFGGIGGGIGMGIGGIISLAQGTPKAIFEMKIDYMNGEHIQLRQVENP